MGTGPSGVLGACVQPRVAVVPSSTVAVVPILRRQMEDSFASVKARNHGNATLTSAPEVRYSILYFCLFTVYKFSFVWLVGCFLLFNG